MKTLESASSNSGTIDQFVKKRKREDMDTEEPKTKKNEVVLELNAEALKECIRQVPYMAFHSARLKRPGVKSLQVCEIVLEEILILKQEI